MIPAVNDVEDLVNKVKEKLMDAEFDKDAKMSMRAFAKSFKANAYLQVARQIMGMIDGYLKSRE